MDRSQVKAREVASRVPLDYYKKPDPVFKRKIALASAAGIASGVWILTMFAPGKTPIVGPERFSHGAICKAHASFGHECSACHTSFPLFGGPREADGSYKGDGKCMECHLGSGGAMHSPSQKGAMTPNCGVCHTDHKGADFAMKRVIDKHCIGCHKDLPASMIEGTTCKYDKEVTSFADKHPKFGSVKADPSHIKFNHKYHMTEGIVLAAGGKQFKVKEMGDGPMKKAFAGRQGQEAGVKMDCADCHVPETRGPLARTAPSDPLADKKAAADFFAERQKDRGRNETGELRPPHVPGAYMAPINYDSHCAACHPLTFDPKVPAVKHKQAGPQDQQLTLLRAEVAELIAKASPPPAPPLIGLPGKKPGFSSEGRVDAVMRSLLEGKRVCGECHVEPSGSDLTAASTTIALSKIPQEWFQHARFQHKPHDFMTCRDCHSQAYGDDKNKAVDEKGVLANYAKPRKGAEDVMIPDIDNCRQCHTPKPTIKAARHDCTECHGYHHGKGAAGAQRK